VQRTIDIGSTVVARPPRGRFGYVASKGAVEALSRALALGLGADGIRLNVIRPGIIPSELRGRTEEAERLESATGIHVGTQALAAVGEARSAGEPPRQLSRPRPASLSQREPALWVRM
jgi:3-oxoacyl-[acyl-carrier protein] reductase